MAIQTQTITGRLSQPNGEPVKSGSVRFTLSKFDATDNGVVAASSRIDVPIEPDGSIALELWPNTAGLKGTRYSVMLLSEAGSKLEDYGFIRVENSGPYSLADLLRVGVPPATTSYWSSLTQEEYSAVAEVASMSVEVTSLPNASEATANYAGGVLSLGIPVVTVTEFTDPAAAEAFAATATPLQITVLK